MQPSCYRRRSAGEAHLRAAARRVHLRTRVCARGHLFRWCTPRRAAPTPPGDCDSRQRFGRGPQLPVYTPPQREFLRRRVARTYLGLLGPSAALLDPLLKTHRRKGAERALVRDRALAYLLRAGPFLRPRDLIQHLKLRLLILLHRLLRGNSRRQVKRCLLIRRATDRADQLLKRREPIARVGKRSTRRCLEQCRVLSGLCELRLLCG